MERGGVSVGECGGSFSRGSLRRPALGVCPLAGRPDRAGGAGVPGDAGPFAVGPRLANDLAWFLVRSGKSSAEAVSLARGAFARSADENSADTLLEALLSHGGCSAARAWGDSLARQGLLPPSLARRLAERCPAGRE